MVDMITTWSLGPYHVCIRFSWHFLPLNNMGRVRLWVHNPKEKNKKKGIPFLSDRSHLHPITRNQARPDPKAQLPTVAQSL